MSQEDPTLHDPVDLRNARERGDCERCRRAPATVTVPENPYYQDDNTSTHGLCDVCYDEWKYEVATSNPEDDE